MARKAKSARLQTNLSGDKGPAAQSETETASDVEQTGRQAVPEGGEAVPAAAGVPAEKPADPVSADQDAAAADGAGEHPAPDPAPAVEDAALDVGAEEAGEEVTGGEEACPVCQEPFKPDDVCATDIELGTCHASCLEGSPVVSLDTGEPSDGPISTFPYEEPHTHGLGDEEPGYALKVRANKARRAAADAFVQVAHEIGAIEQLDGDEHEQPEFAEAAAYLLAFPDAPWASIPVHLALEEVGGSMVPSAQDLLLWGVFADVFRRVHGYLLALDAAAEKAQPAAGGGMGRETGFRPEPGPFDPAGFSPR